ncbi:type II toxin-antitoxin system RelE/ParE family toxin [Fulvivirgaceae bacterium PWU4]|uniref:Type II toxin-antitoxin system RelE/ParE family toxin n=1 Tax=Chryseosolibacter histidini TaxID=2782349 RepID=A0AAP2GR31_9BACT|nr:type II toxin-antitoxin system RelE/ParE family toxin [Chryseosolibacter histidini]MBT1699595.1 type II toxin-antitoxin system RelE/ParE family toxin [Chryseosolibacter histidini]
MAEIVWTEFALQDLKSIHEYISRDSQFYADRFIDKIIDRVEQLIDFPNSGRIVPEFAQDSLRELIEGHYRIVYNLSPVEEVTILRIHHSARLLK